MEIIKEPAWETFLLKNQPSKKFEQYYTQRLKENHDGYWQTLAEAETAYLIHPTIPIVDFNRETVGKKDVDLIAKLGNDEIFIEVTTSQYKSDANSDLQQDSKFLRAMKHASNKFLTTSKNLLVMYDEQLKSTFYDPNFIQDDIPATYFNCHFFEYADGKTIDMHKISALLLFGQRKYPDYSRDHNVWENKNAYNPLSLEWLKELPLSAVEGTEFRVITKR